MFDLFEADWWKKAPAIPESENNNTPSNNQVKDTQKSEKSEVDRNTTAYQQAVYWPMPYP